MRRSVLFMGLLSIGSVLWAASSDHPDLRSGELDALRAIMNAEVDVGSFQRIEVAEFLEVQWDSRRHRAQALERTLESDSDVTPEMIENFKARNQKKLRLWPGALETLGERSDKRAFLISNPKGLHVQYARIGWDGTGERGLVYLELRPRGGSESMRAVFRVVRREADGWLVDKGRFAVDRGEFSREIQE